MRLQKLIGEQLKMLDIIMDLQVSTSSLTVDPAPFIDLQDGDDSAPLFCSSRRVSFHDDRLSCSRIFNATVPLARQLNEMIITSITSDNRTAPTLANIFRLVNGTLLLTETVVYLAS